MVVLEVTKCFCKFPAYSIEIEITFYSMHVCLFVVCDCIFTFVVTPISYKMIKVFIYFLIDFKFLHFDTFILHTSHWSVMLMITKILVI